MKQMEYKLCLAEPDLWLIPKTRKRDRLNYYEYVVLYVYNVVAIGYDPEEVLKQLDK